MKFDISTVASRIAGPFVGMDNLIDAAIDNSPRWDDLPIDQAEARAKVESLARDLAGPTQGNARSLDDYISEVESDTRIG